MDALCTSSVLRKAPYACTQPNYPGHNLRYLSTRIGTHFVPGHTLSLGMTYALSIPGKRHQTLFAISQANQSYGWTLAKYNETENQAFLPTALAIIETKMKKKVRNSRVHTSQSCRAGQFYKRIRDKLLQSTLPVKQINFLTCINEVLQRVMRNSLKTKIFIFLEPKNFSWQTEQ